MTPCAPRTSRSAHTPPAHTQMHTNACVHTHTAAPCYVRGVIQGCLQVSSFTLSPTKAPMGEERDLEAGSSRQHQGYLCKAHRCDFLVIRLRTLQSLLAFPLEPQLRLHTHLIPPSPAPLLILCGYPCKVVATATYVGGTVAVAKAYPQRRASRTRGGDRRDHENSILQ